MQQGDVLLEQTNDDGEITVTGGIVEMTGSFKTAIYLSLFGGNEDDDGLPGNSKTYWGNLDEVDPDFKYISRTQHVLQALPATSSNLRKIEDAAKLDLMWFLNKNIVSSIEVTASIPALNRVQIVIRGEAQGEEIGFTFTENWKAGVN
jgi:phage gp46-like protein